MLVEMWIAFLLVTLFLLGSAVGSFLNVCIVRLPQGRSLIRPGSCCGHCQKPIPLHDNIPLVSFWLLRGRCRQCGVPFSMRYFWIELLTGVLFVLIYHFEVARNIHHFAALSWYENSYGALLMRAFSDPVPWLILVVHTLLACFLIVAALSSAQQRVPVSVTCAGVVVGVTVAVLFPWPWPDTPPQVMMPRVGLYPCPVWEPLPEQLPLGSRVLGLATGLCGVAAGAIMIGLACLALYAGLGKFVLGWGEMSLLMIAGSFLGWQPVVIAALVGVLLGLLTSALWRTSVSFSLWLALVISVAWFGWYWIGPFVQSVFFSPDRLLLLVGGYVALLFLLALLLRRTVAPAESQS